MFTGIIKDIGEVERIAPAAGGQRLTIRTPLIGSEGFREGDSMAVNGVCLTALALAPDRFSADVSPETLRLTTIGRLAPGGRVNLEPALKPSDPLGGHIVTGHVDGLARCVRIAPEGEYRRYDFDLPEDGDAPLARYLARKGSVALDGVSLTVNSVEKNGFSVMLIPHTLAQTTLAALAEGDPVNIEVDLMARYAERMLNT